MLSRVRFATARNVFETFPQLRWNAAPPEDETAPLDYARRLAENAPLVLQLLKRFVGRVLSKGPSELAGIARRDVEAVTDSADLQEGLAAFRAKRPLSFSGN